MSPSRAIAYARANRNASLAELKDFIRFPSVSAQPEHASDVARCASWLAKHLRSIGLTNARVVQTPRHPIVYASWLHAPGRPTLLIYGHYDVQPADPLHEWITPPFEPTIRGDDLFGRGACDDKGQMFTHVKALEAFLKTNGAFSINVKCLFEGEEEIGSPNLTPFVQRNRDALAADAVVVSDAPMLGRDRPAISYGARGALSLELHVFGPKHDLHSGNFGGAVHNPLQALCEIIARLHDAKGRIAIPGVYDKVRKVSAAESARMAWTGPTDAKILADAQTERGWGESGHSLLERLTLRPALTVNGILGGYQGSGAKGVIPSRASAKLSFRLVPDQDPREIDRLFRAYVADIAPATVRIAVKSQGFADPFLADPRHPAMRAAAFAYRKGFGAAPAFARFGGTIPVLSVFQKALGAPVVVMGFASPDDHLHGPNEKLHIPSFFKGVETSIWFMSALAELNPPLRDTRRLRAYAENEVEAFS
jgi:acetylornithine deacetylase/succinyl-diaminopimelate desuccinylase-like protein